MILFFLWQNIVNNEEWSMKMIITIDWSISFPDFFFFFELMNL